MAIEIELFGGLAPSRPRKQQLEPDRPVSAADIAVLLDLEPALIGFLTIDGVQSELEDSVPAGARLCFFPYLSGG
jgi:hypothetical protein